MKKLINHFVQTARTYGMLYALTRLANFAKAGLKILKIRGSVTKHNARVGLPELVGRRKIVIVGNGPSLNKLPLHLLANEHVFVSNNFHLMFPRIKWRPRYHAMTDAYVLMESRDQAVLNAHNYERLFLPAVHASNVNSYSLYKNLPNSYFFNMMPLPSIDGAKYFPINKTVTNFMIRIAANLGYKEILFIGMDLTYPSMKIYDQNKRIIKSQQDDPDHFSKDYFNKGKHFHAPEADQMREKVRETIEDYSDIAFKNVGIGGRLDFIERGNLRESLSIDEQQEYNLVSSHLEYRLSQFFKDHQLTEAKDILLNQVSRNHCDFEKVIEIGSSRIHFQPTGGEPPAESVFLITDAFGTDIFIVQ